MTSKEELSELKNDIKQVEEKIDKLDNKLDEKLEKINTNLAEHMSRTAILETRQAAFEKTLNDVTGYAKKLFWYLIVFLFLYVFKDNDTVLEVIKSLLGAS